MVKARQPARRPGEFPLAPGEIPHRQVVLSGVFLPGATTPSGTRLLTFDGDVDVSRLFPESLPQALAALAPRTAAVCVAA